MSAPTFTTEAGCDPSTALRAAQVHRGLLRDLADWLRLTGPEREESPLAGTPDQPGIFDAGDDPAEAEWVAWAPDPRDTTGHVAIIVKETDFDDGDRLELIVQEDLHLDRVGRGCCEDLAAVRDDLLDVIVTTARRIAEATGPTVDGWVLEGLIHALALVLDVDIAEARRQALRKIASDRIRRAA